MPEGVERGWGVVVISHARFWKRSSSSTPEMGKNRNSSVLTPLALQHVAARTPTKRSSRRAPPKSKLERQPSTDLAAGKRSSIYRGVTRFDYRRSRLFSEFILWVGRSVYASLSRHPHLEDLWARIKRQSLISLLRD